MLACFGTDFWLDVCPVFLTKKYSSVGLTETKNIVLQLLRGRKISFLGSSESGQFFEYKYALENLVFNQVLTRFLARVLTMVLRREQNHKYSVQYYLA